MLFLIMSSPLSSLFSFDKSYYMDPLFILSLLLLFTLGFNLSTEFFTSAIKTFISKSSDLFSDFWMQKSSHPDISIA